MGTRSFADVAPTPATIALNAYIFGYGGHSLVTPHAALKQLWWTDDRIEAKVTRPFVVSKLRGEEREFLDKPLAFGEGLTDDTYMEWILHRAKRLFLILTEIGVPDQIFGCVDDSWDDGDLPVPLESVRNLELSYEHDDALDRRFYDMQFVYLLRELREGTHIDYGPKEHIPMEYVNTLPPAVCLQAWDRVHFPGRSDDVFMRRKFTLSDKETGQSYYDSFRKDVRKARALTHEHIAPVWASYTSDDAGYILSDFVGEHTLGTFIDHRMPTQLLRIPMSERPALLCEWMHCLTDALVSLHRRGAAHTAIRPSNILIDYNNRIVFADVGSLRTFQRGKSAHKNETCDYAAPESHVCQSAVMFASSPPVSSIGAFSKLRKLSSSISSSSSSTTSSNGSNTRSDSFCTAVTSPITPSSTGRSSSLTTTSSITSPFPFTKAASSFRNFSRHLSHGTCPPPTVPSSPTNTIQRILPRSNVPDAELLCELPEAAPEMSDMFSLACIFLDILTFMLKGKLNDFLKYRSTRVPSPYNKNKWRTDTSFHGNLDRIDEWMTLLIDDADRRGEQIYRGVPELLKLTKRMMAQNATLRPNALQVRDRLQAILVDQCGVETLCCASREWNLACVIEEDVGPGWNGRRDSGTISPSCTAGSSRKASDCLHRESTSGDHMSDLSNRSRRRSSVSKARENISAWRRAFVSSP